MKSKVKVNFIVNAERIFGHGGTAKPPPKRLINKIVTIKRPLINWHGYWVSYKGQDYLFSHSELNLDSCKCRDCSEVIKIK